MKPIGDINCSEIFKMGKVSPQITATKKRIKRAKELRILTQFFPYSNIPPLS